MARVLLLLPTHTYRTHDFLKAARKLGVEVVTVSEEPSAFQAVRPENLLTVDFVDPEGAAGTIAAFHERRPVDAILPVDEDTAVVAAAAARAIGLPWNSPDAARAARDKYRMRTLLAEGGVAVPPFSLHSLEEDPTALATRVPYPCVLKPVFLSGSRGVIRADDEREFVRAFRRIEAILRDPELVRRGGALARVVLVEGYVPGEEVALEGLLTDGALRVLAIFDKPAPLEGPFFEETIYLTPSRLPEGLQSEIRSTTERAAWALGLREGAVHAELRLRPDAVVVIEIAARSMGGLCSRTLRFGVGMSLEELLLRHALGMQIEGASREARAAGVMMIPIPRAGVLAEVRGLDEARAVPGVEEVTLTSPLGKTVTPLPEGSSYLGFLFARAAEPEEVLLALERAHRLLDLVITPEN